MAFLRKAFGARGGRPRRDAPRPQRTRSLLRIESLEARLALSGDSGIDGADAVSGVDDAVAVAPAAPVAATIDVSAVSTSMHHEHMAVLDLVPTESATHTAVASGDWSDPNTWASQQAPTADSRVVIPAGVEVTYDLVSDTPLFWVRVDGHLRFETAADTRLKLDTLVVSETGRLTIGDELNPVSAGVSAEIVIADNGPIDLNWDPTQLSRGVVSLGSVEMHGQEKTAYERLAIDLNYGESTITLEAAPMNWEVGDRIVVTGTLLYSQGNTLDEEFVIASVAGAEIGLDRDAILPHNGARDDLKAYVANYTRNIVISTENHEVLPANQRGHTMFMNNDVSIQYAEFFELGRTDKSTPLDDFILDAEGNRILDNGGDPWTDPDGVALVGPSTNIRGRYSLHIHRTGVDEAPAIIVGNSVWGSPGWGYVHHDSHAVLRENAAYNVTGAAFVAETGNETGVWDSNISIRSLGDTTRGDKDGKNNHDVGVTGNGFWLQGRLIEVTNNVAAGNSGSAFAYFMRGIDQLKLLESSVPWSRVARYTDTTDPDIPAIRVFENNEAIASVTGLTIIKGSENQHHDVRSVIDGFLAWEVYEGMHLEYTSKYTMIDSDLLAASIFPGPLNEYSIGVDFEQNTKDMVINNATIEGFDTGVLLRKEMVVGETPDQWHFVLIDVDFAGVGLDVENYDPLDDRVLTAADLTPVPTSLAVSADSDLVFSPDLDDRVVTILGEKTDSLGVSEYMPAGDLAELTWTNLTSLLSRGYYYTPEGERFLRVLEPISDRATGEVTEVEIFIQLDESWATYYPSDLIDDAKVLGLINPVGPGDIDQDNDIDADDIDLLFANLGSTDPIYDIAENGGPADQSDVDWLIYNVLGTVPGDADLDREVGPSDVSALGGSFGGAGGWADGDFDGDGIVGPADLSILSGVFGYTNPPEWPDAVAVAAEATGPVESAVEAAELPAFVFGDSVEDSNEPRPAASRTPESGAAGAARRMRLLEHETAAKPSPKRTAELSPGVAPGAGDDQGAAAERPGVEGVRRRLPGAFS